MATHCPPFGYCSPPPSRTALLACTVMRLSSLAFTTALVPAAKDFPTRPPNYTLHAHAFSPAGVRAAGRGTWAFPPFASLRPGNWTQLSSPTARTGPQPDPPGVPAGPRPSWVGHLAAASLRDDSASLWTPRLDAAPPLRRPQLARPGPIIVGRKRGTRDSSPRPTTCCDQGVRHSVSLQTRTANDHARQHSALKIGQAPLNGVTPATEGRF